MIKKIFKDNKGFTMAELLVSLIVVLLILTILSSIFILNQRLQLKGATKAELVQNGRIVFDIMSREIRQSNEIVTTLPVDNSDPPTVPHYLQFEDGHNITQIQYIKYYIIDSYLKRQIIAYYFDSDSSTYVHWDDEDPFGPPTEDILQDRIIGEYFEEIDFYGQDTINIDITLSKSNSQIQMHSGIHPRND